LNSNKKTKFEVVTSKIVTEHWEIEANDGIEALDYFWSKGKKVKEDVFDYHVIELYEILPNGKKIDLYYGAE
jgi:hypothetical protein